MSTAVTIATTTAIIASNNATIAAIAASNSGGGAPLTDQDLLWVLGGVGIFVVVFVVFMARLIREINY